MTAAPLTQGVQVTLGAGGAGTAAIGPDSARGPATWDVTGVIVQTSRPGLAPIPKCQIYLGSIAADNAQGLSYDGSFAQGQVLPSLRLTRGQQLIASWTGGQAGDVATFTVTGTKF